MNGRLIVFGASSGSEGFVLTSSRWAEFCEFLRKTPSPSQACFPKALMNSWATGPRMGEVPLLSLI